MSEEKSLIKKDYKQKLSNERYKLSKKARARSTSRNIEENRKQYLQNDKPNEALNNFNTNSSQLDQEPDKMVKEIKDLFENTCQIIKNMEKESELFEKSIELDIAKQRNSRIKVSSRHKKELLPTSKPLEQKHKQDLNNCQKLNLTESSSNENYGSSSFEDEINDD